MRGKIDVSNSVLADCLNEKEEQNVGRQSEKITALYCRLSRDDELAPMQTHVFVYKNLNAIFSYYKLFFSLFY